MDRIVIVTGGTKGIGFATAKKFLSCKDIVIILGRHECENAVKELQKEGEVTFMKADVSVADDCCHVASAVMEKYGRNDVLANAIWLMSLPEAGAINGTTVMADDGYSSFKGVDGFQAE